MLVTDEMRNQGTEKSFIFMVLRAFPGDFLLRLDVSGVVSPAELSIQGIIRRALL